MEPICSVIIPFYNKQTTIARAIQSVIDQTLESWELIIIDDCGEKRLEEIQLPQDHRISMYRNFENMGAAATRQQGLNLAKGEYIAFLDADDWWDVDFLKLCYLTLDSNKLADGVYGKTQFLLQNGNFELRRYSELGLTNIRETIIQYTRPWQTGSILWRKRFCGDWGKLKTNEDSWFEIKSNNNILIPIDKIGYFADKSGDGHLSNQYNNCETAIDNFEIYLEIYKNQFSKLNIKFKIILFNRILRGHLKILEYCGNCKGQRKSINLPKDLKIFFFLIGNSKFLLKIFHRVFQNSPFKIHF